MRVTNQMKSSFLLYDLSKIQNDVFLAQRVLNTGKEVSTPSDDPAATRRILQLEASQNRRDQYIENIDDGVARMAYTESSLAQIEDLLVEAKSIALEGSNGATTDEDRYHLAARAESILYEVYNLSNSKHEGQYIFGGFQTKEAPYEFVYGVLPLGDPDTVIAVQNPHPTTEKEGKIYRMSADGERIQTNVTGVEVFQPGTMGDDDDIFQALINLRDALQDGIDNDTEIQEIISDPLYDPLVDGAYTDAQAYSLDTIQDSIDKLDATSDRVRTLRARLGGAVQRLENSEERHLDIEIIETEHLSDAQDADLTEWITKYQTQSIALEQALQITAQVLRSSLVNFIS